ncbi:MAG TPA: CcdC protein domain-containing protein [Sphingomonadaceae bacterium]
MAILGMLYFRARSMARKRPLKPATLWIIPAVFLLITGLTIAETPPSARDLPWLVVALALGGALGWQRGRLMKIWREADDGRLMVQGSPWALIFLVAIILLRMGLRSGLQMEAQNWAISPALINDGFVLFALGLFGVMRGEMALRARKLANTHRAT